MSIRRLSSYAFLVFLAVAVVWIAAGSRLSSQAMPQTPTVISGRNVNMVSGMTLPGGDPWLQRQNEPSIAVSSRNPLHLLAGANDYRTVDMPTSEGELPGKQPTAAVGDAWLGVFMSYDGGESWTSTMLPGFPQDSGNNALKGYRAAADPVVRSGPNGLFYFSGIAFNRDTNLGVVFVARFIDDNNKENGGTIRYIDTKIIAKGTATKFLDKPWISVDQPRVPLTNITISGQTFPRHNVYIAYSSFSGTTTLLGDIMFARSTDCGTSWGTPIKLSTGSYAQQGATIAVKPVIGEIVVAWRRFGVSGRTPDTIYVAQSFSRGASFQSPVKVADVTPFDQPTTDETQALPGTAAGPAFRTNSYPTIAVDKGGHVYLAWSQRGQGPSGDARIVLSASYLGTNWSVPQPVANVDENGLPLLGHQIMPSMTFAAGKLALVWVDQRHDISALQYGFNKWIIDSLFSAPYLNLRHTMDVWAAEAETSTFPNLVWKSSQVSRYLHALLRDQFGEIVYQDGLPVVFPVQFNCVNYPLFKGGHNPFNGDYIDIAASPSFRQDTWRNWIFNTDDQRDPVFHVAWADNRDVRPPLNGNWTVYAPPASSQASAYVSPEHPSCNPNGSGNEPGMRNQNIYTSRLTWGVVAGAPVNDKPLNLANGVARAFVVYVQNNTETLRHFRLSIAAQPAGGQASFDQFRLLSSLDVDIAPYSTISRTVFIRSSDANAPVTVNVNEIDASGAIIADGLKSFVDINSDTSNPQMAGNQETHNPNIVNSANPNIVNWFINPNIVNPNIVNPNIVNPNIVNPNIVNPNIVNPNIVNPNIVNPNIVNPNIVNPNIVNPNIVNPNIVNPNIVNPNIVNPNIVNANPDDITATDVEWTVKNEGTATTSYSLKTLAKKSPPQGVYVQLLVYRVHYTPAVTGAELKAEGVEACSLKQEPHHELVLNVVNPNIVNPNIVNPNIVNPNIVNADIENATFSVAPGEEVVVDLRVLDSGEAGGTTTQNAPQMAIASMTAAAPAQAVTVDEFIQSLGFAVTSHAVNSVDVTLGSQVPPADATDLVIGTASLPDGVVGYSYNAPLNAYGGAGSYVWSLNAGELPPGLSVAAGGAIVGTPTRAGTYQFIVRVDSGGQFDTQQYAVYIDSNTTPDPLNITTTSIPSGVQGVWYGATLQAVGGVWPRSWRLSSGTLPEGVSLDSGGVISGTPAVTGSFSFTARVADRNGTIDTQTLTLVVAPETATYFDITGVVFNEAGALLGGVVLRGLPNTPVTAADGTYADKVPAGWSGTAIPFAAGHTFSPASRTYTNQASSQSSENYNTPATPLTISGNVRLGAIGLVGVHMTGLPGDPTTDTSGTFLVSVNYGWSGSVTPILSGYTFTPPSLTFTTITASQSISFTAATLVGPASRLVFTQSPNGGIGGTVWSTQPMVEIQDAIGNRVTSDNTTQVTLHIFDDPGHGWLDGTTTITAVAGAASFAGLSIDKGGNGYTLQATSNTALDAATSIPFSIEGFMDAMNTLSVARQGLTATPVTLDGTDLILIAGGRAGTSITALLDFFSPIAKTFANPELAMIHPRTWHTATALLDGRILIVGGEPDPISSASAEIFNPANGECTSTSWGPDYPRSNHRATLLQDGRVLITGSSLIDEPVAEIYDPKTGTFAEAGLMNAARYLHTSTLLPNGRVLITGGNDNANDGAILRSAELYDPATGEFTEISGGMTGGPRAGHQATLLDNGRVFITGGDEGPTSSAEIYDSPTDTYPNGRFTLIGNMLYVHKGHQAALLRDGTVLIIGGNAIGDGNEIYDPSSSTPFRATGPMSLDRTNGAVAVLPDGKVLMTGGYSNSGDGGGATDSAEIWIPRTPFPTHIISGTITFNGVGVGGVMLIGLPGHPMTNRGGYYEGLIVDGWDGIVAPTKPGYAFSPAAYEYFDVISDMPNQNYFVTQAAAAKLAFSQQPRNTLVNAMLIPTVTVEIQDELGNLITTATDTVTLSLATYPPGAILSGTLSKAAVAGVATFDDLKLNQAFAGYTIFATAGGLASATSNIFDIVVAGSDQIGAALITTGTYQDLFGPSGNEHWFKVVATEGQDLRISTGNAVCPSEPDHIDLDIYVYNGAGRLLVCVYSNRSEEVVYLSDVHADTYYVRIWTGTQNTTYTLTMAQGDLTGIGEIAGRITNSLGDGVGNMLIEAYPEGDGSWSALKEVAVTDADGTYNLSFTPGNFKLNITLSPYSYGSYLPVPSDPYVLPQWYQGKADFANANAVSISAGATNGGHDDQLADGAAISGMVTSSSGDPILETIITSFTPDGSPTGGYTRANIASYLVGHIRIPASGTVKARFTGIGGAGYFVTWYAGKFSLAAADLITVSPRVTTPGIDVVLQSRDGAGSIQGRVTDGGGNGIPNVTVRAYDSAQGEVQNATTGSTGDYTISLVPPIEARVHFDSSATTYASRWYNARDSFGAADPVSISSGTHATNINAVLGLKTIQLLSPNGGEVWAVGSSQNITWTSSLGVGNVRIEVSTDTGASYTDIAADAENTGTYPWTVPDTPSTACLIRISAAGALVDVSDARFAIAAAGPTFTVSGQVYYSTTTLDGVKVDLMQGTPPGWVQLKTTTSANGGSYIFMAVAPGSYHVRVNGLTSEYIGWTANSILVDNSSITQNMDLPKIITLLTPPSGAMVYTAQPQLTWTVNPQASRYIVQINRTQDWALIESPTVLTNNHTVQSMLAFGTNYTWQVDAFDNSTPVNHRVGTTLMSFTFTPTAAPGSGEINTKQGPINFQTRGTNAFGPRANDSHTSVVFTTENTGTGALALNGDPLVALTGANFGQFQITSSPPRPFQQGQVPRSRSSSIRHR